MADDQIVSLAGAAEIVGMTAPALLYPKNLNLLVEHGAEKVDGRWVIPVSALEASGLMERAEGRKNSPVTRGRPALGDKTSTGKDTKTNVLARNEQLEEENRQLLSELVSLRSRAEMAEALLEAKNEELERLMRFMPPAP